MDGMKSSDQITPKKVWKLFPRPHKYFPHLNVGEYRLVQEDEDDDTKTNSLLKT